LAFQGSAAVSAPLGDSRPERRALLRATKNPNALPISPGTTTMQAIASMIAMASPLSGPLILRRIRAEDPKAHI